MRVLVIDDQEWRRAYYDNLKSVSGYGIELHYLNEEQANAIESYPIDQYDLILLDVVLDNDPESEWEITSTQIARRIRDISKEIAIVLVTGNWTAFNHSDIQQITESFDTYSMPLPFTDLLSKSQFDELKDEGKVDNNRNSKGIKNINIGYFARTLKMIVDNRSKQVYLNKGENESLFILHLSDIQIGAKHEKGSDLEPSAIAQYVQSKYGNPDFIVISGDITENGHPDEFNSASQWISDICNEIGWEYPYERLLLTPGNHDVFAPAFGACVTQYERSDPDNKDTKGHFKKVDNAKNTSIASSFSFSAFREFAYELTKNSYWIDNKNADWIEYRFSSNGVCFFGINSVIGHSYDSPFSGLPSDDYYKEYRKNIRSIVKDNNVLTIAITHHPAISKDQSYIKFSQTNPSPQILLAGHLHKPDHDYLRDIEQLMFVAPTSSLTAELRYPDVNRGFSIMELKRENRKVNEIEYHSHIRVENRWMKTDKSNKLQYTDTGEWRYKYDD